MSEGESFAYDNPFALLSHLAAAPESRTVLQYASALYALHPELLTDRLKHWATIVEATLNEKNPSLPLAERQDDLEAEFLTLAAQGTPEARAFCSELCDVAIGIWRYDTWYWHEEIEFNVLPSILAVLRRVTAAMLRDIVGNPFRPVAFSSSWRTGTAVSLARSMYESRDFSAMPILADALQDADCDNDDILTHCRDLKQVHARGCWVVDLVLGKE